jgi:hypothetical protein
MKRARAPRRARDARLVCLAATTLAVLAPAVRAADPAPAAPRVTRDQIAPARSATAATW